MTPAHTYTVYAKYSYVFSKGTRLAYIKIKGT